MTDDRNLSIREAAVLLGVSDSIVKRLIHDGQLVSYKVGTRRLIPHSSTQDFIAERKRQAALRVEVEAPPSPRRTLRALRGA